MPGLSHSPLSSSPHGFFGLVAIFVTYKLDAVALVEKHPVAPLCSQNKTHTPSLGPCNLAWCASCPVPCVPMLLTCCALPVCQQFSKANPTLLRSFALPLPLPAGSLALVYALCWWWLKCSFLREVSPDARVESDLTWQSPPLSFYIACLSLLLFILSGGYLLNVFPSTC